MLTATHLSKSFANGATAVRNVSLTLEPGRIMGLVGASGSGKSTLLNLLAGLADADTGEVRLNGERVPGPGEVLVAGHPQIRLVHQDYQLMPNVSIRENIAYALRFSEKTYRNDRVDELLKRCRLTPVQHRLPRQVSGGEKQRTAIARAVADKPNVLLLDEPFSHLDLPNRLIMRDLLFDLIRHDEPGPRPTACLFVTHETTDALSLADTLGILRDGKLVELGAPMAIYHQPVTAYAARLTGSVNVLRAKHLPALGLPECRTTETNQPEALICLRPEKIRFDNTGVDGTVRAVFFKGNHSEIEVEVSRYVRVLVFATRHDLRIGQQVRISISAESVWPVKN